MGTAADFALDISETDLSQLTARIQAPSGREEPCVLKKMANNHTGSALRDTRTAFVLLPSLPDPVPSSQGSPLSPARSANTGSAF